MTCWRGKTYRSISVSWPIFSRIGEIFLQIESGWKSTSRMLYRSLISGRARLSKPLLRMSLMRMALVGAEGMLRRLVKRVFLFFRASSISTRAPRDREVLMTGMARADRTTKEAYLVKASSVTAGLSRLTPWPDCTATVSYTHLTLPTKRIV